MFIAYYYKTTIEASLALYLESAAQMEYRNYEAVVYKLF